MMFPCAAYPLRQPLEAGESLRSFMHRLVETNALPYYNWLIADLGMTNVYTPLTPDQLKRLSVISRTPASQFAARQGTTVNRKVVMLGHRVPPAMTERYVSRICLPCFRMGTYHRLVWDFTPVTVCHIHGCRLVGECPACGSPLDWRRNLLGECPNNHSLLDPALDQRLTFAPPAELAGTRAVQECLSGERDGPHLSKVVLNANLSLSDLVEMLEVLGNLGEADSGLPSRDEKLRYRVAHYHQILNRGYAIASNWPHGLYHALDSIGESLGNSVFLADPAMGCRELLNRQLVTRARRTYAKVISQALWNYAEAKGIGLSPGAFGYTPPDFHERFVVATAARNIVKKDIVALGRIAKREKWIGAAQLATGKQAWLKHSDLQDWLDRHPVTISPNAAAKKLRVTRPTVLAMNERGLFGSAAKQRARESSPLRLLQAEFEVFTASLKSVPLEARRHANSDYVNWGQFSKRPHSETISFADVLAGVLDQSIRVSSIDAGNLPVLRFNLADAISLATQKSKDRMVAIGPNEVPITIGTVVSRYRIGWYHLRRAISLGLLKIDDKRFKLTKAWITDRALKAFFSDYITSALLASAHNKSGISLARTLIRMGVKPHQPEQGLYPSMHIYAWKDIHAVGLPKIMGQVKDKKRAQAPMAAKWSVEFAQPRARL